MWYLVGTHLVLLVTALTVSPDAWHLVPVQDLEQALASKGSHASRDSVRGHTVDPDDLISDLDAAIGLGWAQSVTTHSHWELT